MGLYVDVAYKCNAKRRGLCLQYFCNQLDMFSFYFILFSKKKNIYYFDSYL